MKLKVNKHRITEGGVVEVRWDCRDLKTASGATVTIDNGFKKSSLPVEVSGSKKFRLNRSEGDTVITVSAVADGMSFSKEQKVTVKPQKKRYDSYTTVGSHPINEFFKKISRGISLKIRGGWQSLPQDKRHAWLMLGILLICFMLSLFWTEVAFYGLGILTIYLIWTLL